MAGSTASGIAGTKPYHQAATTYHQQSLPCQQSFPTDKLRYQWNLIGLHPNINSIKRIYRGIADMRHITLWPEEIMRGKVTAKHST